MSAHSQTLIENAARERVELGWGQHQRAHSLGAAREWIVGVIIKADGDKNIYEDQDAALQNNIK